VRYKYKVAVRLQKTSSGLFFAKGEASMAKSTSSNSLFLRQGKVRDVYVCADERRLFIVASDHVRQRRPVTPELTAFAEKVRKTNVLSEVG